MGGGAAPAGVVRRRLRSSGASTAPTGSRKRGVEEAGDGGAAPSGVGEVAVVGDGGGRGGGASGRRRRRPALVAGRWRAMATGGDEATASRASGSIQIEREGDRGSGDRLGFGVGGLSRGEGPVGPVGWPAGPLAQLARGGLLSFFLYFSFLLFFVFCILFLFCFILVTFYFSFVKCQMRT